MCALILCTSNKRRHGGLVCRPGKSNMSTQIAESRAGQKKERRDMGVGTMNMQTGLSEISRAFYSSMPRRRPCPDRIHLIRIGYNRQHHPTLVRCFMPGRQLNLPWPMLLESELCKDHQTAANEKSHCLPAPVDRTKL